MRILLIEDNSALFKLIDLHLSRLYIVDRVCNSKKARFFLDAKSYDLLILDLDSTDDDGRALCHYLRDNGMCLSVLLLTTTLTIEQKINCLQNGADYLIKPFNILELLAKARNLLRENNEIKVKKLINIDLELEQTAHKVYVGGKEVALNRKEYALLELFLGRPKQILSRAVLAEKIWQGDEVLMGNTIETTISHLRKKIGKETIKTVKGVGYTVNHEL